MQLAQLFEMSDQIEQILENRLPNREDWLLKLLQAAILARAPKFLVGHKPARAEFEPAESWSARSLAGELARVEPGSTSALDYLKIALWACWHLDLDFRLELKGQRECLACKQRTLSLAPARASRTRLLVYPPDEKASALCTFAFLSGCEASPCLVELANGFRFDYLREVSLGVICHPPDEELPVVSMPPSGFGFPPAVRGPAGAVYAGISLVCHDGIHQICWVTDGVLVGQHLAVQSDSSSLCLRTYVSSQGLELDGQGMPLTDRPAYSARVARIRELQQSALSDYCYRAPASRRKSLRWAGWSLGWTGMASLGVLCGLKALPGLVVIGGARMYQWYQYIKKQNREEDGQRALARTLEGPHPPPVLPEPQQPGAVEPGASLSQVDQLISESSFDSSGVFTIDLERAIRIRGRYTLEQPNRWVLKLVQAVVCSGATALRAEQAGEDVCFYFEPGERWTGRQLLEQLGQLDKDATAALNYLKMALWVLSQVDLPFEFHLKNQAQCLTSASTGLSLASSPGRCTCLKVLHGRRPGLFRYSPRRKPSVLEDAYAELLHSHAAIAPIPITLAYNPRARGQVLDSSSALRAPLAMAALDAEANWPGVSPPASGRLGQSQFGRRPFSLICVLSLLPYHAIGWVEDGVVLDYHSFELQARARGGLLVLASAHGLPRDASGLLKIDSSEYRARLEWIHQTAVRQLTAPAFTFAPSAPHHKSFKDKNDLPSRLESLLECLQTSNSLSFYEETDERQTLNARHSRRYLKIEVETQQQALQLCQQLQAGASFDSLARAHSRCPSRADGGLVGHLPELIETALSDLQVSETSPPIPVENGYAVFRRLR
ncbi:MAG: peptidylprolyl isomerase [Vulcanimicrobiota bacterium]